VEGGKRTSVFVWGSIAAAAAGIIAVAVILQLRDRKKSEVSNLRDVQDVLSDCYQKIREIEDHIPENRSNANRTNRAGASIISNGSTVLDS
jgi:hypothetical protein